jgi:hypothetical protein
MPQSFMTKSFICAIGAAAIAVTAFASAPAHAKTAKACEAEYKAGKADIQKAGTKKTDFITTCRAQPDAAAATPAAPAKPAAAAPAAKPAAAEKPAAKTTAAPATPAKPAADAVEGKPGRVAMIARERACGADWKADKAAGKTGDQKWPQYWSDCNKRKKAQGM